MASPDVTSAALDAVIARSTKLVRATGRRAGLADCDLDELVQDVRIRLWHALPTERIIASSVSYVYRAARTAALDIARRRGHAWSLDKELQGERSSGAPDPGEACEARELRSLLSEALESLSDARRCAVRLRLQGFPSAEIAARLGWTGPKTRKLVSRGLGDLRAALQRRGVGPLGVGDPHAAVLRSRQPSARPEG
jgi:RNA polymerase sigma factor (sigma-70 family)